MASVEKISNIEIIKNKDDLDNLLSSGYLREREIAIKLFDEETKKQKNYYLLDEIARKAMEYKKNGLETVYLIVPYERLNRQEFFMICNFYKYTKENFFVKICVNHRHIDEEHFFDQTRQVQWDIKTIIKANLDIDRVCDFIKKSQFSPLEALAFIHQYITNVADYNPVKTEKRTWSERDQFFAGAYQKLPEIVCTGYSALEKEIIDNLNMPGLKCETIGTMYFDKKTGNKEGHARCYIEVKDDKYGIHQSCFDDPTWDRRGKNKYNTYSNFAMNNKCHNPSLNSRYIYQEPYFDTLNRDTFAREITDYNYYQKEYNKGKNKLDQHTIEKIFFTVLQKSNRTSTVEDLLGIVAEMTLLSYNDQVRHGYSGYISSEKLQLSTKEAQQIFESNSKQMQGQVETPKRNSGSLDTFINNFEKENLKEISL